MDCTTVKAIVSNMSHEDIINPGGDKPIVHGAMDMLLCPLSEEEARAALQVLQQYVLQHIVCSLLT
jgi:hypothetical protein